MKKLAKAVVLGAFLWCVGACLTESSFDTVGSYDLVLTVFIVLAIVLVALTIWLWAGQRQ